jgi:hypothetical protein
MPKRDKTYGSRPMSRSSGRPILAGAKAKSQAGLASATAVGKPIAGGEVALRGVAISVRSSSEGFVPKAHLVERTPGSPSREQGVEAHDKCVDAT